MSEFVIGMLAGAGLVITLEVVLVVVIARSVGRLNDDDPRRFDDWD